MSEDGKTFTLDLRRGLKWSDGEPFTADDFVFWFEDIYGNQDIVPTPIPDMTPEGQPGRIVKVDDYTVNFEFDVPFFLFEELMMGDTLIGGGQAVRQSDKRSHGGYAPGHYLKQFLPSDEKSAEELDAEAKAEGFDNWVARLHFKKDWTLNPELPVLGPWKTVQPINNPTWVMERNPYYWAVDTEGNQLPYIDGVAMTLVENLEVLNLRAIAGDYDLQERHIDLGKLPVILENQEAGDYTVHLDLALQRLRRHLPVQPELRCRSRDREVAEQRGLPARALARHRPRPAQRDLLARRRHRRIAGTGREPALLPGRGLAREVVDLRPRAGQRAARQDRAHQEGRRGLPAAHRQGERLRIEVQAVQAFLPWPKISEMVADQWQKIGIQADVKDTERSLAFTRTAANEHQIMVWNNGGTELLYLFPRHAIPVDPTEAFMGPEFAKWYASGGTQGREPDGPAHARDPRAVPERCRAEVRRADRDRPRRSGRS